MAEACGRPSGEAPTISVAEASTCTARLIATRWSPPSEPAPAKDQAKIRAKSARPLYGRLEKKKRGTSSSPRPPTCGHYREPRHQGKARIGADRRLIGSFRDITTFGGMAEFGRNHAFHLRIEERAFQRTTPESNSVFALRSHRVAPASCHRIRRRDGMGKIFRDATARYRTPTDAKHPVAPRNDPRRTEETVVRSLKITNSVTRERR